MKHLRALIAGLLVALSVGVVAQQSGGFPSRPNFQSVTTSCSGAAGCSPGGSTDVRNHICNQGATTTNRCWSADVDTSGTYSIVLEADAQTGLANALQISRVGGAISNVLLGGVSIFAQDSGALTWSFTTATNPNCSAGGTNATVQLRRRGVLVYVTVTGAGSCSSAGATTFITNNAPVPAAFRPASAAQCGVTEGSNAGGNSLQPICVTSGGNFQISNPGGSTTLIGVLGGLSTVYSLD